MFKIGIYGCGNRTKMLINSLINDGFYEIGALYDISAEAAQAFADKYGGIVYRTPEELMESKEVDAFLISLSPHAHAEVLRKVIPIGKPIFIEKPVTFTGRESKELADLAEKHNVMVQVGFMRRYLPSFIYVQKFISENDPGRYFNLDARWLTTMEPSYMVWNTLDTNNFRKQTSQIPFHCCHMLDNLCLIGGNVKSVTTQLVDAENPADLSPGDLDALIRFENGCTGRFHFCGMAHATEMSYNFYMENYSIKAIDGCVEIYRRPPFKTSKTGPNINDKDAYFKTYKEAQKPEILTFGRQSYVGADENIMYDFVQMVRDGIPPKADLRQSARVQGLAEAMEISGSLGKTIFFDEDGVPILD